MNLRHAAASMLLGWTRFIQKAGVAALLVVFALAFLAFRYTAENLGMNTDTKDMLSAELPWRKVDLEYEKRFPQYNYNLLVVVEAATPDQALDAADLLYRRLQQEQALFDSVYYPGSLPVFRESGLLYLDIAALQDLADQLAAMQPFLAKLAANQSLQGLFEVLTLALEAAEEGENPELTPILIQINAALEALRNDEPLRVSWQALMSGENDAAAGTHREFIVLQPALDYAGLFPATRAIDRIHELYEELNLAASPGAEIHLTGKIALAHEELLSVITGVKLAMALALTMVILIMLFGLGSVRLALVTIISLATGLIFTAAFATLTVGRLNLISVAFAVLYIGLGVDFAIHYCLRYREYLRDGEDPETALSHTSASVGGALFLCAASTAIGFFAFIPTNYTGVAELGWISGFGMFISFAVSLTVIPALLSLAPLRLKPAKASPRTARGARCKLADLPSAHAGKTLGVATFLVLVCALPLGKLRFDHNPLNLHDQDGTALRTFRNLLADNDLSPWTGIMVAADAREADRYRARFEQSDLVEQVLSVENFIPGNQEMKLSLIDEMSLLLGDLSGGEPAAGHAGPAARMTALRAFQEKLRETRLTAPILSRLRENLAELLGEENPALRDDKLARLETSMLASLPGRLEALNASLNADVISLENLPAPLRDLWLSADGHYRLEIYPKKDLQDNAALREFVRELQSISPRSIGPPVINLEAGDAVAAAFRQAFLYALIGITLMLFLLLSRKRDVLLALIPLLAVAVITGGAGVLFGIPLNFANVIALPLLLGIGVDSGIHIIHRFRTDLPDGRNILATSSARAVIVSSLTTMGGAGNLSFSPHAGTASLGLLLTLGIGITLICMLVILPALLACEGAFSREGRLSPPPRGSSSNTRSP